MKNKIYGFAKDNRTYYKLNFNEIEETVVHSVCGKTTFDFLWLDSKILSTIFFEIQTAFAVKIAAGGTVSEAIGQAMDAAAPYVDKNSFLTIYIAAYIDYLAESAINSSEAVARLTAFMGSDFAPPVKGSAHYLMNFINSMIASIGQKKAEISFYIDKIMKDDSTPLPQRFIEQGSESDLFKFDFETEFDTNGLDDYTILSKLETMDDVIRFDIMQMLNNKVAFKPCKCCGKYFIPGGRVDSEYCDRIMPGETKPCNEIGALKTFDIVHKNDAIHKAYITAYRRMDSRQRAKLITKDEFKAFGKKARAERKRCYNGEITLEEFQRWLDGHR